MNSFKKTNIQVFKSTESVNPDSVYWKKLSSPYYIKEFGGKRIEMCVISINFKLQNFKQELTTLTPAQLSPSILL